MEYIKQLNAYNLKLITEPISPNARSVYMSLMDLNNRLGWVQDFSMSNGRLAEMAGLSVQQLNRSRQELIDNGYIKYQKGQNSKQSGKYKIVLLYQNIANFNIKAESKPNQSRIDSDIKAETLNRQDKTIPDYDKEKAEKESRDDVYLPSENKSTHSPEKNKALDSKKSQEEKTKCKTSSSKKTIIKKINYAENVKLTKEEYDKLVAENGEELIKACITKLDNYKGSSGKKYKSDYRAILSWVLDDQRQKLSRNGAKKQQNNINRPKPSYTLPKTLW